MTQDTWQYQGRQQHGEWGHGTAPHADKPTMVRPDLPASATIEGRATYAAHGVVGQLPLDKAGFYASRLHYGMLDNFQTVAAAHPATAALDDATYRAEIAGDVLTAMQTGHLRRAAAITHDALTLNALAPATDSLAALLKSAGLSVMDKGLATAAANAAVYRPAENRALIVRVRAFDKPVSRVPPEAVPEFPVEAETELVVAGRAAAAVVAAAVAADLAVPLAILAIAVAAGYALSQLLPAGDADAVLKVGVIGHPNAMAVMDGTHVAIVVVGPPGNAPATLTLELREVYLSGGVEGGAPIFGLADSTGKVMGSWLDSRVGSWFGNGALLLTDAGEKALTAARAVAQAGAAFGTHDQEEAELVSRLLAAGKGQREIQIALDDLRASRFPVSGDRWTVAPPEVRSAKLRGYRATAIANDPVLKAAIDSGAVSPDDIRVHHLIPNKAVTTFPALFEAAARAGWRPDAAGNLVALPNNEAAQQRLKQATGEDRGQHRGPHPEWNERVLKDIETKTRNELPSEDDPGYDAAAKRMLDGYQNELRLRLSNKKVTMRETDRETA